MACLIRRSRAVGHVVEWALWVGIVQVDRWRHDAPRDREKSNCSLHGARGSQEVPHHGFRRAQPEASFGCVRAEGRGDRPGLLDVSRRCGSAMRVHVVDLIR